MGGGQTRLSWNRYFIGIGRLSASCSEDPEKQDCEKSRSKLQEKGGSQKRLSWNEYFIAVARLSATRSKDPKTQVGACIVSLDKKILATGYNGMPWGCSDDEMPWVSKGDYPSGATPPTDTDVKTPYVVHAEYNAIINKQSANVTGCVMYVTLFPCNECAKLIIQSKIAEVVYVKKREEQKYDISADMLREAGVKTTPYTGKELIFLPWEGKELQMTERRNQ